MPVDERHKEPPKIEIPEPSPRLVEQPRSTLLIQRDSRQRLESPERHVSSEPRIAETPTKKDSSGGGGEHESMGSPRIILKIAKSALAECSAAEPRSPKSPKIRQAADSPNPEDSPGQKLGKIKLKLSRGGHPSIIPNNEAPAASHDEWHTDGAAAAAAAATGVPALKLKLTKSAEPEARHEEQQPAKEEAKEKPGAHKAEEARKPEGSIGMKFKLLKSGDASIVPQEAGPKDGHKHKDTKETIVQVRIA